MFFLVFRNLLGIALLVISLNPLLAIAGHCTHVPTTNQYKCGRVQNQSKVQMRYTTDPNESGAPNKCNIWNWDSNGQIVSCTQKYLNAGQSIGGGSNTPGVDVDAFTFAQVDYWIQSGTKKITKGVWTKINDATTITCVGGDDGGMPYCY